MANQNQPLDPALMGRILNRLGRFIVSQPLPPPQPGQPGSPPQPGQPPQQPMRPLNLMQSLGAGGLQQLALIQTRLGKLPGGGGEFGHQLHEEIDRLIRAITVTRAAVGNPQALAQLQREHEERLARERQEKQAAETAQLAKDKAAMRKEQFGQLKGNVSGMFERTDAGQAASMAGAVGNVGMLAGGPIGLTVAAIGKLGEAVFNSVDKIMKWNEHLRAADFQFAQFSSSMAQVRAESQVSRMMISAQRGERRAPSAQARERSAIAAESKWAPILDNIAIAANKVMEILNKILVWIADFMTWLGLGGGGEPPPVPVNLGAGLLDIADHGWASRYGAPLWGTP